MPLPLMKIDLKSLGVIQTMIGTVILMLGIVIKNTGTLAAQSGAMFWGSVCFFISGSLAVSIVDYHHPSVVKFSLVMNLISAVAAGVAFVLFCVNLAQYSVAVPPCNDLKDIQCVLGIFYAFCLRIYTVLLVFFLLEICVSIWSFVLTWRARGSTEATT